MMRLMLTVGTTATVIVCKLYHSTDLSTTAAVLVSTTTAAVISTISRYQANNGPRDIVQIPAFPLAQPTNVRFPLTKFGNITRCFHPTRYNKHSWSIKEDSCFCYLCRMLGASSSGSTRPEFVSKGFQSWKYATGKTRVLYHHTNYHSHTQAQITWGKYKVNSKQSSTISGRMNSDRPVTISNNQYLIYP